MFSLPKLTVATDPTPAPGRALSPCGRIEPALAGEPAESGDGGLTASVVTVVEVNLMSGIMAGTIACIACTGAVVFGLSVVLFSADFPLAATAATSSRGVAEATVSAVCKASAKLLGLCPAV